MIDKNIWLTDKLNDVPFGLNPSKAERLLVGVQQVHVSHVALADPHQDDGEGYHAVGTLHQQPLRRLHVYEGERERRREHKRTGGRGEKEKTKHKNEKSLESNFLCRIEIFVKLSCHILFLAALSAILYETSY